MADFLKQGLQPDQSIMVKVIEEIIRLNGYEVLSDNERVLDLFSEIAPNNIKENLLLIEIMKCGVWDNLIETRSKIENEKTRLLLDGKKSLKSSGIDDTQIEELFSTILGCKITSHSEDSFLDTSKGEESMEHFQSKVNTDFSEEDSKNYEVETIGDNGELEIVKFNGIETENMTIPGTINGKKVIALGDKVFINCTSLKKIVIPEGIETIGCDCFSGCTSLEFVNLPDSLVELKEDNEYTGELRGVFSETSLINIELPPKIKYIPSMSFYNCQKLEKVTLGDKVETIGLAAFSGCYDLKVINLPSSLRKIHTIAFSNCKNLKEIEMNEGLIEIGESAFEDCTSIISFTCPSSLEKIGKSVFRKCKNLKEVIFNEGLKTIKDHSLYDCWNLEKVFFPRSLERISEKLFADYFSIEQEHLKELIVYCYPNSVALQFARDHKIKYADASKL